jgi:dual specificity tyrosine-phosphorylation-regulated kinase 1
MDGTPSGNIVRGEGMAQLAGAGLDGPHAGVASGHDLHNSGHNLHVGGHSTVIVRGDCAIKFVNVAKCKEIIAEALLMSLCDASGVMRPVGIACDKHIQMTMPAGRSLHSYICAGVLSCDTIQQWSCQLARAVEYIHSRGIIHCDIKPENVIVCGHAAKLADFGIAMMQNEKYTHGYVQTVYYRAIEIDYAQRQVVSPCMDVWSLGCVMYEMISATVLFASTCEDTSIVVAKVFHMPSLVLKSRDERIKALHKLTRYEIARALRTHAGMSPRDPHVRGGMIARLHAGWWDMIACCLLAAPYRATAAFVSETAHACVGIYAKPYKRWRLPHVEMDEMLCLRHVDIRAWQGMTVNEFNMAEYIVKHTGTSGIVALFIANCVYQQRESASEKLALLDLNIIQHACEAITLLLQK